MNKIIAIAFLLIVCACSSSKQEIVDGVEKIPVEVHEVTSNVSSFIEKIEIVPLETNDSSLLNMYSKIMYDKDMDIYAIYTKDQVVFTFSGDGNYIANSKKMQGQGPNEYFMALNMQFNHYMKGIDLMNPYGTIYTYNSKFEFLTKRKIKPEFPLENLMSLDLDEYIFTYPFLWTDQEVLFANFKTQKMDSCSYNGTISGNNMGQDCFYKVGNDFYFIPEGVNYNFYKIDTKARKLIPVMYLDFGDSELKEDGLPGRAMGKRVNDDGNRDEIIQDSQERYQFVKKSNHVIPLLKFFNDDYVYIYLVDTPYGYGDTYIFNRNIKKGYLLKDRKPFFMNYCFGIVDNVLLSICQPDEVDKFIDRKFMSPEEITKMEQLTEDDNPVIIKYYLK